MFSWLGITLSLQFLHFIGMDNIQYFHELFHAFSLLIHISYIYDTVYERKNDPVYEIFM